MHGVVTTATTAKAKAPETLRCELVSWEQFCALARQLALRVRASGFTPDMIVAIGRGGCMPARLLSDYLDIYNLSSFKIEHYRRAHKQAETRIRYPLSANVEGLKLLLVDDVSDAGDTLEVAVSHLHERGPPAEIRTAVLHHKTVSSFVPGFGPCSGNGRHGPGCPVLWKGRCPAWILLSGTMRL